MKTISFTELEEWQDKDRCFALLDVLPDSVAQDGRLPETRARDFVEKITQLSVSKDQAIVLYEADTASIEAAAAADALCREGFDEVYCFTGPRAAFYASQHGG
ncbi:MAG: hypothetical protein B7Z47_00895 [Chthoniobacter sp. 12-60-6]|nr:MAG: hypothetical protein B7Z47_00895 [Chthoniobacter sp. 12-60-6]